MANKKNNFTNPYGAVLEYAKEQRDQYIEENDITAVTGKHGKIRHSGKFSSSNPYLAQLEVAKGNQDKDALYELAVQWEADYANRQMQLEENRAILEEQREYDSPLAQTQRMREAGINPDLEGASVGSGSGNGSAQLANPGMADQTGQTKFSNQYDNLQTTFAGINSAASFAGALTSGVSGIMNAVSTLKTVPSQIALNEANAGLSSAKAGEINALLEGKKKSLNLSNVAQGIQNSTATLQQLAEFSHLIAPDTADFAPHLKALGVEEANIAPYTDMIKQMHANPEMRDKYAKAELSARWSEAENAQYTDALVGKMTDLSQKMELEKLEWEFNTTQLQNRISKILNNVDHAHQLAQNEVDSALVIGQSLGVSSMQFQLAEEQLAVDLEAFYSAISDRAVVLETITREITALEAQQKIRKTPDREAIIQALRAEQMAVRDMLSTQYYNVNTHLLTTAQQVYHSKRVLDENGWTKPEAELFRPSFLSSATFDDLIQHRRSDSEIARDNARNAIGFMQTAVDAAAVGRGFGFNSAYKKAHDGTQYRRGYEAGIGNPSAKIK